MFRLISVLLFLVFLLVPIWIKAQNNSDLAPGAIPFSAKATVQTESILRDSPPHGFLNLFVGKEVEQLPVGEEVLIVGKRTYGGFSGRQVWYQIDSNVTANVWVFGGTEGFSSNLDLHTK